MSDEPPRLWFLELFSGSGHVSHLAQIIFGTLSGASPSTGIQVRDECTPLYKRLLSLVHPHQVPQQPTGDRVVSLYRNAVSRCSLALACYWQLTRQCT